jgi:peptide/nickel transport system permease protein
VFLLLVVMALAAPLYAEHVANTTPDKQNLTGKVTVGGEERDIVSFDGIPTGPTWQREYLLGADINGRDVAVRLLYAARNSMLIGVIATLITTLLAIAAGVVAGYYRGPVDWVISRAMDVMWAVPVLLLGVALGVALTLGGVSVGPVELQAGSLWIPTVIIGVVSVVYLARPLRGEVLRLREQEFVDAARAQGASGPRIMVGEILPNVLSTVLVFFPLLFANAVLLEAALSYLGAGVQPPEASWGTMIDEGIGVIITQPLLTIAPGMMLVICVLSLNLLGEAVRKAIDPRARVMLEQ